MKRDISKPAFWFLLVSEPQKPIKTDKNQETGKLGNPGPISQKPHMSTHQENTFLLDIYFFYFSILYCLVTLVSEQSQVHEIHTSAPQAIQVCSRATLEIQVTL